jgi:formylglycine-generating enzyme
MGLGRAALMLTTMAVLAVAASCNAVFGIEAYGPGGPADTGVDTGRDASPESSEAAIDTGREGCAPGATQCLGSLVETCSGSAFGSPVACEGGTPYCSGGMCTATRPSCAPGGEGMTNCGASNNVSCCMSDEVDGGTYDRAYTNAGDGGTGESDPATVSGFRLDQYLVTVARFRPFVDAWTAGYRPADGSGKHTHLNGGKGLKNSASPGSYESGWSNANDDGNVDVKGLVCDTSYATWTPTPGSNENLPMNCVSWYDAYAFCIWDGGFLPSEAEWEYAAAGGSDQREYPWGSKAPGTDNAYAIYGCNFPSSGSCSNTSNIAPVGTATKGAGAFGQLDMAGDLAEWTLDYEANYVNPCIDCAYLTDPNPATGHVIRGGTFSSMETGLYPWLRAYVTAGQSHSYGFRCAMVP